MWRVNFGGWPKRIAKGAMNHDSRYATAEYPQYSQIESKQVIFASASIKRACLRIFTRRCVNNDVSTASRYTSSRPLGWWHFRIGFLLFSVRSPLYSRTINPTANRDLRKLFVIDHPRVHNHHVRSSIIPENNERCRNSELFWRTTMLSWL